MFTDKIKIFFSALIAIIITILGGYGYVQKKRADSNAEEIDELEDQIKNSEYNHEVKNFEAISNERKNNAENNIDDIDIRLDDGVHSL